jgi:hypothetical protein
MDWKTVEDKITQDNENKWAGKAGAVGGKFEFSCAELPDQIIFWSDDSMTDAG